MFQYCRLFLLVLILCQAECSSSQGIHGPSVRTNSYTLPVGLERINGSEGEGGCNSRNTITTPPLCMVSGSSIPSELTDGFFPYPESMTRPNWAEGFFTVNRRNSSTIEIGFRLERSVVIGEVQLSLLNCPTRGIGAPNITLYGNLNRFPEGFNVSLSTQLGSTTPPEGSSCTVQTQTVSSSLNDSFQDYFLVFNYEKSPNTTWLFLGEVQFFEPPPPPMTDSTSIPTLTTFPSTSPTLFISALTTSMVRVPTSSTHTVSSILNPDTSTPTTTTTVEDCKEVSTGALVGSVTAIILTLLLSVLAHTVICLYLMKRRSMRGGELTTATQEAEYDYIDQTGSGHGTVKGRNAGLEMKVNDAYGEVQARAAAVEMLPNESYTYKCIGEFPILLKHKHKILCHTVSTDPQCLTVRHTLRFDFPSPALVK